MPEAHMRLIIDAGSEKKTHRVIANLLTHVNAKTVSSEPYHKGGFDVSMKVPAEGADWPSQVVSLIAAAQAFGIGWALDGDISDEVSMTSSSFKLPGLKFASLSLRRL